MKRINTITRRGKLRHPFMPNGSKRHAVKTTIGAFIDLSHISAYHHKCITELQEACTELEEVSRKQIEELIKLRRQLIYGQRGAP